jgi:sensor domain CHASE-containing protein
MMSTEWQAVLQIGTMIALAVVGWLQNSARAQQQRLTEEIKNLRADIKEKVDTTTCDQIREVCRWSIAESVKRGK